MGPKVRLDHDYCIFMTEGGESGRLHGGPEVVGDHWYKYWDGVMRNGLSVITYFLTDAAEGDGGFACIPGSHKTNFLSSLPDDIRNYERPTHYVVQPAVEAGDALFFTEALIHGTMQWRAKHERRSLLYKYSPRTFGVVGQLLRSERIPRPDGAAEADADAALYRQQTRCGS